MMKTYSCKHLWIPAAARAVTLSLPSALWAQNLGRLNDSTVGHEDTKSDKADVKVFKGQLMSAYAYLAKEMKTEGNNRLGTDSRSPDKSSDYRTPGDSRSTSSTSTREQNDAAGKTTPNTPGNDQRWQADRNWEHSGMTNDSSGPIGLVVDKDGFLGIGSGNEFCLLIADPNDPKSQETFSRISSFSRTGNFLSQTERDRTYVKDTASDSKTRGTETDPSRRTTTTTTEIPDGDRYVRVTGRMVERGDLRAILVQSISPASRDSEAKDPGEQNERNNSRDSSQQK
jgi:hypothetical protein